MKELIQRRVIRFPFFIVPTCRHDKAKRMGENGRKRILKEFTVEKMIKETENIYMELLEQENILNNRDTIKQF